MTGNSKYGQSPDDRANDTRLITPLVLMGLIIAGGLLFAAYHDGGHATVALAPAAQTAR